MKGRHKERASLGRKTGTVNAIKHGVRAGLLTIFAMLFAVSTADRAAAAPFAAYVMDGRTGQTLYAQNAETPLHPASLTKMMTLYLAFAAIEQGRVRLDSKFTVSSFAASMPPSKLGLRPGQQIELRYLIRAAAVKSANDAATVIGENLAGSEPAFAAQMTSTARALGMRSTKFRNANGLSADGHYSSARDMTILGRHLFYDFPQYYSIFSRRSADAGVAKVSSTNSRFLDNYAGADGIKTGYTRAAGFNLTASAQRGNKRVMATVLGGTSTAQRNQVMAQMLDLGFGKSAARVAEVRPTAVIVQPERVRRAKVAPASVAAFAAPVQSAVPAPVRRTRTVAAAAPVAAAPAPVPDGTGPDLSAALREAMASRPAPSPERSASTAAVAAATPAQRRSKKVILPVEQAAAAPARIASRSRPTAKPEGSSPESGEASSSRPVRRASQ